MNVCKLVATNVAIFYCIGTRDTAYNFNHDKALAHAGAMSAKYYVEHKELKIDDIINSIKSSKVNTISLQAGILRRSYTYDVFTKKEESELSYEIRHITNFILQLAAMELRVDFKSGTNREIIETVLSQKQAVIKIISEFYVGNFNKLFYIQSAANFRSNIESPSFKPFLNRLELLI